jgi:DNA-3-methyladenine glycosylase I
MDQDGIFRGEDGKPRCWWCSGASEFIPYHDQEWGMPVADDVRLFEKISLEGFQSGLSWRTILNKLEAFREAFEGFDFSRVARFTASDVERLLGNAGIVRHRKKIEAVINNASRAREMCDEFGSLAAYFWRFEPDPKSRPELITHAALMEMSTSSESVTLAKDLKRRGWSFVGPTTVYAFMQAMGLVNDHIDTCYVRPHAESARIAFEPPE